MEYAKNHQLVCTNVFTACIITIAFRFVGYFQVIINMTSIA